MAQIRPLTETLQQVAIEELHEKPERIAEDVLALRTWIEQQPHLTARSDDQFLVGFLRGCKYSLERCKHKLDRYYTLRTKFPELFNFTDVNAAKFREVLNLGVMLPLPNPLNENGPRILLLRNGAYPAEKYTFEDVFTVGTAMQEILLLEDDNSVVCGTLTVMDAADVTMAHFFQMTPALLKKISLFSEEAMPQRQKGSHFINTPVGFNQIFNIFKPMLSAKQQNRLFVYDTNIESLYANIPKKYLPKEYGGENGTIPELIDYWHKKFDEYVEHFRENAKYGTNEKLRVGKPIDFNGIFGVDGSFRKLDVD